MITYERKISPDELARTLPLLTWQRIRNAVLTDIVEGAEEESAPIPKGIEWWYRDGELLALAQSDDVEAGFDHGNGRLIAEFEVGPIFERCITCGREAPLAKSSWCSQRCRNLLRPIGRREAPGASDLKAFVAAEKWAVIRRNSVVGWWGPLTREIAEGLYPPDR